MLNRNSKVLLAVGTVTGLFAMALAFFGGSHLRWTSSEGRNNFDIQIGAVGGAPVFVLTTISITGLFLGAVFLSLSGQSRTFDSSAGPSEGAAPLKANRPTSFFGFLQNLTKSDKDVWLGGVCGGLGEHTPIPAWVWRMLFAVMLSGYGVGGAAYIVLWIFVPETTKERRPSEGMVSPPSQSK